MKTLSATIRVALLATGLLYLGQSVLSFAQEAKPAGTAATPAGTQTPKTTPTVMPTPAATPTTTPTPTPTPAAVATVKDVYKVGHEKNDPRDNERHRAGIGDSIVLQVENLKTLADRANCLDEKGETKSGCEVQQLVLFLDDIKIEKLYAESVDTAPGAGTVRFHLERTADSDHPWADVLGAPPFGSGFFERETSISVGLENESPIADGTKTKFHLIRIHLTWFIGGLAGVLLLIYYVLRLARESDMLRDFGLAPTAEGARKPYSLARCQMAFWFILVVASFLFIWMVTNALDIITGSTLALIGIGSGTALGAAAIEASNASDAAPPKAQASEGFLKDILNDPMGGVSFHRFQMFVWTIVLGLLFLYSVWKRLSMPDFGSTLLALQGISAGTYLGFKIPESRAT